METAKRDRINKARTLTCCIKELYNVLKNGSSIIEVNEKISAVKYTFKELGDLQDNLISLIEDEDVETIDQNTAWYDNYDEKVNQSIIAHAREYIQHRETRTMNEVPVKLVRLTVPVFESDHKKYLKWKETFERYTNSLTEEVKYDYLLSCTKGKSNELVSNKKGYWEVLASLDKEFGNKLLIMGLLIDDLKSVPVVKRGDCNVFENLAYAANMFRDRLNEMGLAAEAENTYILRELESKLMLMISINGSSQWERMLTKETLRNSLSGSIIRKLYVVFRIQL